MKFWNLKSNLVIEQIFVSVMLLIFLNGFLNVKPFDVSYDGSTISHATDQDLEIEKTLTANQTDAPIKKIVLMVIDAFRADHLVMDDSSQMNYSNKLLDVGSAQGFLLQTATPTVTLPRIKSIVTGSIPAFIDVIMNFGSTSLSEENLIHFWAQASKKVNFYGDETWLRLFPQSFHKWHGVTSLFVADFTEVDNNVTYHLNQDLAEKDWDVLILHYLGLDHIGHLEDPKSPLMKPKLQEMDSVIQKIHTTLLKEKEPYAIFVCGDHGMGDAGGHGGSSPSEIFSSLLVISNVFKDVQSSFTRMKPTMVHQADLAPTLAFLTGVEIPAGNIGQLLKGVLKHFPIDQQLRAYYASSNQLKNSLEKDGSPLYMISEEISEICKNATLLHNKFISMNPMSQKQNGNSTALSDLLRLYDNCQNGLSTLLKERKRTYDLRLMGISTFLIILAFVVNLFILLCNNLSLDVHLAIKWQHIIPFVILVLPFISFLNSFDLFFFLAIVFIILKCVSFFLFKRNFQYNLSKFYYCSSFIIFLYIIHPFSFLSTSFVEEEHQTHYFFVSLSHFLLFVAIIKRISLGNAGHIYPKFVGSGLPFSKNSLLKKLRNFFSLWHYNVNSIAQTVPIPIFYEAFLLLSSWVLFRLVRSFNATGDKWKHLEDLNDAIRMLGPNVSRISSLCGTLITYFVFYSYSRILVFLVLFAIYQRHSYNVDKPKLGTFESQIAYLLIFVLFVEGIISSLCYWRNRKLKKNLDKPENNSSPSSIFLEYINVCFSLLFLLLQKPENILPTALSFLQLRIFTTILLRVLHSEVEFVPCIILWLSSAHFFTQGNSNSLTTVQISAGFVGITSFRPVLHGILIAVHTFGWKFLTLLYFIWLTSQRYRIQISSRCSSILSLWWLSQLLIISLYTLNVSLQRHHLFIWSVMAPKLLYEGCNLLLLILITCCCYCMQFLHKVLD